ncbi:hypothetical protein ACFQSB_36830, partial [Sphaerisporangium rhizosphaerae]
LRPPPACVADRRAAVHTVVRGAPGALRVVTAAASAAATEEPRPGPPGAPGRRGRRGPAPIVPPDRAESLRRDAARLSAGHRRTERPPPQWRTAGGPAPGRPVPRPAPPAPKASPYAAPLPFPGDPPSPRRAAGDGDGPGAPPAIDVERLTDDVVRRIDRRIVAHRERLGLI